VGWDAALGQLAARQHGVVSLAQLRGLGICRSTAQKRVAAGRLHCVHHGTYAVGHPLLTREGRYMSAVLACGPDAVLSHRSAAALAGLREDLRETIDVTAPNRRGRIPRGIAAHRDGALASADRAKVDGIPCTSVARTLLDLAAVVPTWEVRKAISEAEVLGSLDRDAVRRLIKRSRGWRGVARLRTLLDELDPATKVTRSELERRFLRLCRDAGLPRPEVNTRLGLPGFAIEPDFLWREPRLIVEADGRRFHDTASAFERDRRRDQRLMRAGWRVVRCTWRQVVDEPGELARTLRAILAPPRRRA
jgi:very-short-patch-repair endonuclease